MDTKLDCLTHLLKGRGWRCGEIKRRSRQQGDTNYEQYRHEKNATFIQGVEMGVVKKCDSTASFLSYINIVGHLSARLLEKVAWSKLSLF